MLGTFRGEDYPQFTPQQDVKEPCLTLEYISGGVKYSEGIDEISGRLEGNCSAAQRMVVEGDQSKFGKFLYDSLKETLDPNSELEEEEVDKRTRACMALAFGQTYKALQDRKTPPENIVKDTRRMLDLLVNAYPPRKFYHLFKTEEKSSTLNHSINVAALALNFYQTYEKESENLMRQPLPLSATDIAIAALFLDSGKLDTRETNNPNGIISADEEEDDIDHIRISVNNALSARITNPAILGVIYNHHRPYSVNSPHPMKFRPDYPPSETSYLLTLIATYEGLIGDGKRYKRYQEDRLSVLKRLTENSSTKYPKDMVIKFLQSLL